MLWLNLKTFSGSNSCFTNSNRRNRSAPNSVSRLSEAASVVFFPQFLFLLWILIVSILMFLRSKPTARTV